MASWRNSKIFHQALFIPLFLHACTNPSPAISDQHVAANNDTAVYTASCAVIYRLDSARAILLAKVLMEDFYRDEEEEYRLYLDSAEVFLHESKIAVAEAGDRNILQFMEPGQKATYINTDSLWEPWGIIVFKKDKAPLHITPDQYKTDIGDYFFGDGQKK